jgi:preprotein translocase subunit SecD
MLKLVFNKSGKQIMADVTKHNVGKLMAILVNDKVLSSPTIQGEIPNGEVVISGIRSVDELKGIVKSIRQGIKD